MPYWLRRRMARARSTPNRPGLWVVIASLTFLVVTFVVVQINLNSTILALSKVEAEQMAVRVLSNAVQAKINVPSSQLFHLQLGSNQAVIQPNTSEIDKIAVEAAKSIQNGLKKLPVDPVYIPLGQALGSKLLAAYGPQIPVNLIPYGAVSVNFSEEFHQAGINQVIFIVYLDADTMVQIVIPLVSDLVHLNVRIPIAQEWYAGQVPSTYVTQGQTPVVTIPLGRQPMVSTSTGTGSGP